MGRNILVVEDDKNISDLIYMYLVKEGFDVRIAGDGGKALPKARSLTVFRALRWARTITSSSPLR